MTFNLIQAITESISDVSSLSINGQSQLQHILFHELGSTKKRQWLAQGHLQHSTHNLISPLHQLECPSFTKHYQQQ